MNGIHQILNTCAKSPSCSSAPSSKKTDFQQDLNFEDLVAVFFPSFAHPRRGRDPSRPAFRRPIKRVEGALGHEEGGRQARSRDAPLCVPPARRRCVRSLSILIIYITGSGCSQSIRVSFAPPDGRWSAIRHRRTGFPLTGKTEKKVT